MQIDDNKVTITKSPDEILQLLILQRREDLIDSIERYNNFRFAGGSGDEGKIRSRLNSLFHSIKAPLKNDKDTWWFNNNKRKISNVETPIEDLLEIYEEIEDWLYEKGLTKFDGIQRHDYHNIEEDNESAGL